MCTNDKGIHVICVQCIGTFLIEVQVNLSLVINVNSNWCYSCVYIQSCNSLAKMSPYLSYYI